MEKLPAQAISNYRELDQAMIDAQREGLEFLEVTPELFEALTKGQDTMYLTMGKPGVKIYKAGTKEMCDEFDTMTCEDRMRHDAKKAIELKEAQKQRRKLKSPAKTA